MSYEFKTGDLVKCVNASHSYDHLQQETVYEVSFVDEDGDIYLIHMPHLVWYKERFVPADQPVEEPDKEKIVGEFKVGDIVRCIDAYSYALDSLVQGDEYEVTYVDKDGDVLVKGSALIWYKERFVLA